MDKDVHFYHACGYFLYVPSIFRTDRDVRGTKQERCFYASKNSRPEVYTDVHFWTVYFKRLTEEYALRYAAAENSPRRIRTAMDGGGSTQQRVCAANT